MNYLGHHELWHCTMCVFFVYCQFLLWMILLLHFVQCSATLFQDSWSLLPYLFPKPSVAPDINIVLVSVSWTFHSKSWIKLKQPSERLSVTPERLKAVGTFKCRHKCKGQLTLLSKPLAPWINSINGITIIIINVAIRSNSMKRNEQMINSMWNIMAHTTHSTTHARIKQNNEYFPRGEYHSIWSHAKQPCLTIDCSMKPGWGENV